MNFPQMGNNIPAMGNSSMGNMPYNTMPPIMPQTMPNMVISGPKDGTSIESLAQHQNNQSQPMNIHPSQQSSGLNDSQISTIMNPNVAKQHKQFNDNKVVHNVDKNNNTGTETSNEFTQNIKHLVKDINRSLDDYIPSKSSDTDSDNESEISFSDNFHTTNYLKEFVKEPLLLLFIYIILSQTFVRKSIGHYIPLINSGPDGSKGILCILIYGTILTVLYTFFKKVLI